MTAYRFVPKRAVATSAAYVLAIVAANLLTEHLGAVQIGFGLSVTAGTFAAGAALAARNYTQDAAGRAAVVALMMAGVALSWWLATPALAIASGAAFGLSELADMAIYTPLRFRGRRRAQLLACGVGALVDSWVFLTIAGFPVTWGLLGGQVLVKLATVAALLAGEVGVRRALLRQPVNA